MSPRHNQERGARVVLGDHFAQANVQALIMGYKGLCIVRFDQPEDQCTRLLL